MKRLVLRNSLLYVIAFFCINNSIAQLPIYKDKSKPVDQRVKDLLSRMTIEEKFWEVFMIPGDLDNASATQYQHGLFGFQVSVGSTSDISGQILNYNSKENAVALAKKINAIQKYFVEKTRLGIPIIAFDEALHGLVREGATSFPQSIGLAATWDTAMMSKVSNGIALETKIRGIRQILSPVINIAADPRWGRTEETYGEDPFLSAAMGVAFVKSFEQMNIITTPKHFIANVGDGGRDSYPIHMNERLLKEIYFLPFKECFEKGGTRSVMTCYNSLDGIACSANSWLLQEKLKKEMGFSGFIISDANAVGGEVVLHNTAKDYSESGMHAMNGGLDVIFQTDYKHHELFIPAFLQNKIDSNRLNDAVSRVLKAKFELGLFEQPYINENFDDKILLNANQAIAAEAARKSIVLLKNNRQTLPLSMGIKKLAVIGMDANEVRLGGYSGKGNRKISILEGIKDLVGKSTSVIFEEGCGIKNETYAPISADYLLAGGKKGLKAEYFNNVTLEGSPVTTRQDEQINFHWTLFGPSTELSNDFYSARWTGELVAPASGKWKIGLEGSDGFRLYINGKLFIDHWQKQSYRTSMKDFVFEKGKKYSVKVEFFESSGNATVKLVWEYGVKNSQTAKIAKAVTAAQSAEAVIIVAGIHEGEFQDRAFLSLPGRQEEMIKAIAKTGKPVIVLLVGGSAITMDNWINDVNAIASIWYPGEQGGRAVADVLFGKYNPAGRLPITFPIHESQLPYVYNHKPTGRGDDYHNLTGLPLFPFGFGLSYSSFQYSNIKLSKTLIEQTETVKLTASITNTSKIDGEEVVQLYIKDVLASLARPIIELKGFQRIPIKAGETKLVEFEISPEMLSMLDINLKPVVEPGDFNIMLGASSRDIRLKTVLTVK